MLEHLCFVSGVALSFRFGVVEVVPLLASATWLLEEPAPGHPGLGRKTQGSIPLLLTMGRVPSTLLAAGQGPKGARGHPSGLQGKLSPCVQRESFPPGNFSLEKDHFKLSEVREEALSERICICRERAVRVPDGKSPSRCDGVGQVTLTGSAPAGLATCSY